MDRLKMFFKKKIEKKENLFQYLILKAKCYIYREKKKISLTQLNYVNQPR